MINNAFKLLSTVILAGFFPACEESPSFPERKAVIEATFNSGGYPIVLFSSSIAPGIDGSLADAVINWGKVTISDGEREAVLTGFADKSYLPPYRYTTLDMQGEPGKTYTLTARFNDLYAESTINMPYPVAIDSVSFAPTEVDSLRAATLHFTSPTDTPSFFYLSLQSSERGSHASPCLMGCIRTDSPDAHYSIAVLKPKIKINQLENELQSLDNDMYVPQLVVGEEWIVWLNRVEESVYNFWKAYDNMVLFSTSPFISANESLPTNLIGGYGVWSPQGSASLLFRVE